MNVKILLLNYEERVKKVVSGKETKREGEKTMKKVFALVLALAMLLAVATAFAGKITITPPEGVDADSINTYRVYKVFDAIVGNGGISYKLVDGKTTAPNCFTVDSVGNVTYSGTGTDGLTADDIAAIKAYVTDADLVATVTASGTNPVTTEDLGDGYFFIDTTTGTVVTIDSTTEEVVPVKDKNTVPTVEKTITDANSVDDDGKKALAQAGSVVEYQAVITVGTGAKGYVFHDVMETGLTYNEDAAVTGVDTANYTVGQEDGDTFTITFADAYLATLDKDAKLTITYSATVNDDAITTDPLNNTAYVSYGDSTSQNKTPTTEADVYEAKFTVTKHDGSGAALAGAGFKLKNADGKYYKISNKVVSWVDSETEATEFISDSTGAVTSFTGLANGTYTLTESTVPGGYNGAEDSTFTIAEHDYSATNLEQTAEVKNNVGTELPSTGGIGTTIFYVVGGLLVIGCSTRNA